MGQLPYRSSAECRQFVAVMTDHLDTAPQGWVAEHLLQCAGCTRRLARARSAAQAMRSLQAAVPGSFPDAGSGGSARVHRKRRAKPDRFCEAPAAEPSAWRRSGDRHLATGSGTGRSPGIPSATQIPAGCAANPAEARGRFPRAPHRHACCCGADLERSPRGAVDGGHARDNSYPVLRLGALDSSCRCKRS